MLSLIAERVSGMPFGVLVKEKIFKPLKMNQTLVHDNSGLIINQRADSYMKTGEGNHVGLRGYQSTVIGDNNVYSTIGDMIKWVEKFREESIGGKGFANKMFTRGILNNGDTINYAMGLVVEPYRGLQTVSHSGLSQGYKSHFLNFPDQGFTVICLANGLHVDVGKINRSIADVFLAKILSGKPYTEFPLQEADPISENNVNDSILKHYVGKYGANGNLVMIVNQRKGSLYGQVPGQPEFEFQPSGPDAFVLKGVEAEGLFLRDSSATVCKLLWKQGGNEATFSFMEEEPLNARLMQQLTGTYYSPVLQTVYDVTIRVWFIMAYNA